MKKAAFTLIELSIVLVIIGLIIGGVLVGKDLIEASQIRATVSQVQQFDAAVLTFRNKYNCLPGDCPNPMDFGLGAATGVIYGNGDGIIGIHDTIAGCCNDTGYKESRWFWQQLMWAGMIPEGSSAANNKACENYTTSNITVNSTSDDKFGLCLPPSKLSYAKPGTLGSYMPAYAAFYIRYYSSGHYYQLLNTVGGVSPTSMSASERAAYQAACGLTASNQWCNALRPRDAFSIDSKLDDGLPMSGRIRATNTGAYHYSTRVGAAGAANADLYFNAPTTGNATQDVCVDNTTTPFSYNVANENILKCSLNIKASW